MIAQAGATFNILGTSPVNNPETPSLDSISAARDQLVTLMLFDPEAEIIFSPSSI